MYGMCCVFFFHLAIAFVTYELYALMILIPWNLCLLQSEKRFALSFQLYGNTGNTSIHSKYTQIKMCDFFVFFQSDIEEKNRPNTINIWFGMIVNWSRTCFDFNFTRDEFVYVFFFCQM